MRASALEERFREPNDYERALFAKLVEQEFPGRPEVGIQLRTAKVRRIDTLGCLEFAASEVSPAVVRRSVPVEAEGEDEDGITVHFLLHIVDGFLDLLEIYKEDGSGVIRLPEPSQLRLFLPDSAFDW